MHCSVVSQTSPLLSLQRLLHNTVTLLPFCDGQYRGPCPLEHTLLNGDTKTAVSVIQIEPSRFDVGNILSLADAPVEPDDTLATYAFSNNAVTP